MASKLVRSIGVPIARAMARTIFAFTARVHLFGIEHLPTSDAAILASNHISHFDPPILGSCLPRPIDWMAMEELFRHPVAARLLWAMGAFPINRNAGDRAAIRTALQRLDERRIVGMFPEGGIRAGETSVLDGAPMRSGVGALCLMSGCPIVPCVILGSERFYHRKNWLPFRRVPVWIGIGASIHPDKSLPKDAAREKVREQLARSFVDLKEALVAHYHLDPADLPKTPQARKGEDPFVPRRP